MQNKIGMLTTHSVMNYGGLLQAYALKQTITHLGYTCCTINYIPDMQNATKSPLQFLFKRKNVLGKAALVLTHRSEFHERQQLISRFREDYLKPEPYDSISYAGLPAAVNAYDALVCGSDQLWNLALGDMENGAYFLNFPHKAPAITYSVSFGDGIARKEQETLEHLDYIRAFSRISVRESEAKSFLAAHGIESELCVDPTLLLDVEVWKRIASPRLIEEPYILVYGFENAFQRYDDLVSVARNVSKTLNLSVVNALMVPELSHAGFHNHFACGPLEFLSLILHAEHVCTNSFHACVFSHLFDTPFSVAQGYNLEVDARKKTLLEMLGQESRVSRPGDVLSKAQLEQRQATTSPSRCLAERRNTSIDYLSTALREVCG